jgi:2-polyprenyl-6-methoxyphenol hydroxylase-like FAD-dependent oxidoreductase
MSLLGAGGADVAIVGAGLAGASAASVLARAGLRVALLDPRDDCAPTFKAEKIEPDQAELLRRFGLLDGVTPATARIRAIEVVRGRTVLPTLHIEQYGVAYQDLVNAVRAQLPAQVAFQRGRVSAIELGPERQRVRTAQGACVEARLVVLACGTGARLHEGLGLRKRMIRAGHSICAGFTIAPLGRPAFSFESLTYHARLPRGGVDYVTLFLIRKSMRVNLFAYWAARDPWVRALSAAPAGTLERLFPQLSQVAGPFAVTSKVEIVPIDLYEVEDPVRAGLVCIGDAYQSVCPATGTGLSKVLNDVDVLRRHAPAWLATPGMDAAKIAQFYADPQKRESDARSLSYALYRRRYATERSWRMSVHRGRVAAQQRLASLRARLGRLHEQVSCRAP